MIGGIQNMHNLMTIHNLIYHIWIKKMEYL